MRIVTFNIHHGTVGRDGLVDPRKLGATCAAFGADVLALQEVDRGTWRARGADLAGAVADACAMDHVFGPSRRFPGGWYGNALFVRGRIETWSVAALPRTPEWKRWQERRTAIVATMAPDVLAGGSLAVVATHLAVPQDVSAPQLDRLVNDLTPPQVDGRPRRCTVVLGDLNRFPKTVEPAAVAAGLTYVAHGPTNPVLPERKLIIDHVLLSPDLAVTAAEVHATEMSDHAALVVDVDVDADVNVEADPNPTTTETTGVRPGATKGIGR